MAKWLTSGRKRKGRLACRLRFAGMLSLLLLTWAQDSEAAVVSCHQTTPPSAPVACLSPNAIWCLQDPGGGCSTVGPPYSYTSCSSASPPYAAGFQKCQWTGGPPVSGCSPGAACAYDGTTGICMNSGTCRPHPPYCASTPSHWGTSCYGGSLQYAGYCAANACHMECAMPGTDGQMCPQPTNPPEPGECSSGGCVASMPPFGSDD